MRVQAIGKSFLLAFAGAGVVSFFLMMAVIPALAAIQRFRGNVEQSSVVVNPAAFMRTYGIGAAIGTFLVLFVISVVRFYRMEHAATQQ
jgi:fumarate reductase subunit D